jgi:hypothetical protein
MGLETEEFRNRKISTFGECVYCATPANEAKLTDEHIVPFSLGGTAILQSASCDACSKITSQLELHLARTIFGHYRIHANVATRNRRERPTLLPTTIKVGDSPAQHMELPIADHPYFTLLPVWKAPGMLTDASPTADFGTEEMHRYEFVPAHFRKLLSLNENDTFNFQLPIKLDQNQFSRALAKIAYCTAICRYGLTGFERTMITEFIRGKYPFAQFLVGSTTEAVAPPMPNMDHAIGLTEVPISGRNTVVAFVRLFARTGTTAHGMPYYTVVVGTRF